MPHEEKLQTILISPTGTVFFVQEDDHPAFELGPCKQTRISDVAFNETTQLWEINFLKGGLSGAVVTDKHWTAGNRKLAIAFEVEYLNNHLHELLDLPHE